MTCKTCEELRARIERLENDNREIGILCIQLRDIKDNDQRIVHDLEVKIAGLEAELNRWKQRDDKRKQRRLDHKANSIMMGGIS